jgi:hypothetical protein
LSGPGAWYWQGMIFSVNLTNKDIKHKYPEKSGEGRDDNIYRGYAVDVGFFDGDSVEGKYQDIQDQQKYTQHLTYVNLRVDVVVSAPRASNYNGYVEIFSSNFKLLHVIHGYQVTTRWEYFLFSSDRHSGQLNLDTI